MSEEKDDELSIAQSVPIFYTNSIAVTTSGYDLSVLFLREVPGSDGPIPVKNLLVYMSPMLAKRFNEILSGVIQRYEENVGVIPLPPERPKKESNQNGTDKDSE